MKKIIILVTAIAVALAMTNTVAFATTNYSNVRTLSQNTANNFRTIGYDEDSAIIRLCQLMIGWTNGDRIDKSYLYDSSSGSKYYVGTPNSSSSNGYNNGYSYNYYGDKAAQVKNAAQQAANEFRAVGYNENSAIIRLLQLIYNWGEGKLVRYSYVYDQNSGKKYYIEEPSNISSVANVGGGYYTEVYDGQYNWFWDSYHQRYYRYDKDGNRMWMPSNYSYTIVDNRNYGYDYGYYDYDYDYNYDYSYDYSQNNQGQDFNDGQYNWFWDEYQRDHFRYDKYGSKIWRMTHGNTTTSYYQSQSQSNHIVTNPYYGEVTKTTLGQNIPGYNYNYSGMNLYAGRIYNLTGFDMNLVRGIAHLTNSYCPGADLLTKAAFIWGFLDVLGNQNFDAVINNKNNAYEKYDPNAWIDGDMEDLVKEILFRHEAEQNGYQYVGRVIPYNYTHYFHILGGKVYFATQNYGANTDLWKQNAYTFPYAWSSVHSALHAPY